MKRLRALLFLSAPLWLLLGVFAWQMHRYSGQGELDRALWKAVRDENVEGVREALGQGANPNARENPDPPPAGFVARMQQMIHPPKPDESKLTPLHLAAHQDNREMVELLLRSGADINARWDTDTPLMLAANRGGGRMVTQLLAAGADPNARNSLCSALWITVSNCEAAAVRDMLDHGAKLDPRAESEEILMAATTNRDPGVMALLLDRGFRPDARIYGSPILSDAARNGNVPVVQLLLRRGADVRARSSSGETAIDAARGGRKDRIADPEGLARYDAVIKLLKSQGGEAK